MIGIISGINPGSPIPDGGRRPNTGKLCLKNLEQQFNTRRHGKKQRQPLEDALIDLG